MAPQRVPLNIAMIMEDDWLAPSAVRSFRRPKAQALELEFLCPLHGKCRLVIMLSGKSKEDVPIGTEVWAIEKSAV